MKLFHVLWRTHSFPLPVDLRLAPFQPLYLFPALHRISPYPCRLAFHLSWVDFLRELLFSLFLTSEQLLPCIHAPFPLARLPAAPSGIALLLSMRNITLRKVYHSILSDEQLFSLIRDYYTTCESIMQSYFRIFFDIPDSFLGKMAIFMNNL